MKNVYTVYLLCPPCLVLFSQDVFFGKGSKTPTAAPGGIYSTRIGPGIFYPSKRLYYNDEGFVTISQEKHWGKQCRDVPGTSCNERSS